MGGLHGDGIQKTAAPSLPFFVRTGVVLRVARDKNAEAESAEDEEGSNPQQSQSVVDEAATEADKGAGDWERT